MVPPFAVPPAPVAAHASPPAAPQGPPAPPYTPPAYQDAPPSSFQPSLARTGARYSRAANTDLIKVAIGGAAVLIGVVVVAAVVAMAPVGSNSAKSAVRAYLKENLHDPVWEEVRWKIEPVKGKPGSYCVDLKYRSKNGFGAKILMVDRFFVTNGTVTGRHPELPINWID